MITEEINRNPKLKIKKVKMLCDIESDIDKPLDNYHFCIGIIAPPAGGKTNLLINLVCNRNQFYNKKFNRVVFWSPSVKTIKKSVMIPDEQIHTQFNMDDVKNELELINERNDLCFQTLFIFDDMIKEFKKNIDEFKKMVFNRRHFSLSVIITTQYYNLIPKELRQSFSSYYFFKLSKAEFDTVYKDIISIPRNIFDDIIKHVFDKKYNFLYVKKEEQQFYKNYNLLKFSE